jgi:hypothetical protein
LKQFKTRVFILWLTDWVVFASGFSKDAIDLHRCCIWFGHERVQALCSVTPAYPQWPCYPTVTWGNMIIVIGRSDENDLWFLLRLICAVISSSFRHPCQQLGSIRWG